MGEKRRWKGRGKAREGRREAGGGELERERGSWKGREGVGVGKLNCLMEQNPTIQIPTERRGQ